MEQIRSKTNKNQNWQKKKNIPHKNRKKLIYCINRTNKKIESRRAQTNHIPRNQDDPLETNSRKAKGNFTPHTKKEKKKKCY